MKLTQIRHDSVNAILALREDGKRVSLENKDGSEIASWQFEIVRNGRSTEAAESAALIIQEI